VISSGETLAGLQFRPAAPARARLAPGIAVLLVLLLHWAALAVLRSPPWRPPAAVDTVFEVVFIEPTVNVLPLPAWPEPPPRHSPARPMRAIFRDETAPRLPPPPVAVDAQAPVIPRLFTDDGGVRLPDAPPAGPAFAAPRPDARSFGQRTNTLPGSDQPLADIGVVVRTPPSPEQRVMRIAAFVGLSRPPTDDCRSVERRMLAETNAVARAIALEAWDRRCRGWR
jgi:hypothetical protein